MSHEEQESLQVLLTVRRAGRIFEDARNHVWFVPTRHPIFNAVTMVAGPVSRQIANGYLSTGVEGTRRYAVLAPEGRAFLSRYGRDARRMATEAWLTELLPEPDEIAV